MVDRMKILVVHQLILSQVKSPSHAHPIIDTDNEFLSIGLPFDAIGYAERLATEIMPIILNIFILLCVKV